MASSSSSKRQDPSPVSAPLGSPISPRFRRGSTHSLSASSAIDREQLAQTLDKIHISASRCDSLTTFKEFAPPAESAPASESRGSASELVQNGISGLYSRIREVVGGSALIRTAPTESSASNAGIPSKRISFAGGHSSRQSISSATRGDSLDTPRSASSEQPPRTDATPLATSAISDRRSLPQTFKPSSINLLTGLKSSSVSRQSLPTHATSSVVAGSTIAPPVSTAHRDPSRSTIRTNESGRQGSYQTSVEKNDSRGTLSSSNLSSGPRDGADVKVPVGSGDVETSSKDESADVSAMTSQNSDPRLLMKQGKHLRTTSTSSSAVVLPRPRKPAILDRLARSRSPPHTASHESSPHRGRISPSRLNPSAHMFGHSDPSGHLTESHNQQSGVMRLSGAGASNARASDQMNAQLDKMRKQVLSKEFWMKDDTVKECFLCQTPFSAFRRKHHCRTCGCIFDSKCTTVVPGEKFGVQGSLRVCKNCLEVITRRLEVDASDDSGDDRSFLPKIYGPKIPKGPNASDYQVGEHNISQRPEISGDVRLVSTPLMAIPATRRIGDANRSSAILEIDAPQLSRPGSSRSLRSAMARPQSSGHRRHHSRHGLLGRFKSQFEDRTPSRRATEEDASQKSRFPIFLDEGVNPDIDDDLSDDSSADEQLISAGQPVNAVDLESAIIEDDKESFAPTLSTGRRQRHRSSEKAAPGMSYVHRGQLDEVSGPASLNSSHRKPTRRRNVSNVSGSGHYLGSPRPRSAIFKGPTASSEMLFSPEHPSHGGVDLIRSDSLRKHSPRGDELNDSSLKHVNKLLEQLLTDAGMPSPRAWRKALVPILSKLTDQVTPNLAKGEDMDIRHYVKLKKIPGGRPGDTTYVSGVVFTKNLALKSMQRKIRNPRIVLVTFPIEYQRHQQHFMSLQPVIEQEKEFLRVVVQRITNMRPHVLLAQKSVSGVALQYLSDANIAVAYNVKDTVIEAVARCAEAEIIESLDMLALPVRIGKCSAFEVRTFVNNDFPGRKKSYIFLSGCRPDLGCTVALRGADTKKLGKVKHIVEFMVYVVYNLKLETNLLRDESIEAPEHGDGSVANAIQSLNTSTSVIAPDGVESHGGVNHDETNTLEARPNAQAATIPPDIVRHEDKDTVPNAPTAMSHKSESVSLHESQSQASQDGAVPDDVPMPSFYSDMVAKYETKILSASPYVKFKQPYLLMKAREQERRLLYLRRLKDQDAVQQNGKDGGPQRFQLITPEMVDKIGQKAPRRIMEVLHAVHDAEYDKALFNYQTQTRQWETHIQSNLDLFDPYSHQNIVVLYSVVCTDTKIPCIEPTLVAINFYDEQHIDTGMDPDCTLGQFIEDLAYGKDDPCNSNGCEKKMVDHHRTYVHDQYRITVFVEHATSASSQQMAFSDEITMWTYCKECKKDFGLKAMSEATFRYSFGKYLELLYWGRGLRMNKLIDCQHDRQHDHVRYFQLGDSRIRIHWDPIDLLEIIVPRARITWKVINDLRLKNEIYTKMEDRWAKFMSSVRARLKSIRIDSILPEKAEACQAEIERLTKEAQDEQAAMVRQLQSVYVKSKYYEVVPFNSLVREMLEKAGEWDQAFAKFEGDFLGDKDIRQLTMLQLKKMFSDNESKESLVSQESATSVAASEEASSRSLGDSEEKQALPSAELQSAELEQEAAAALSISHEDEAQISHTSKPDGKVEDGSLPLEDSHDSLQARDEPSSLSPINFSGAPHQQAQGPVENQRRSQNTSTDANTSPSLSMSPAETGLSLTESSISARSAVESTERRVKKATHKDMPSTGPVFTAVKSAAKATERGPTRKSGASISPPMVRSTSHPSRTLPRSRSAAPKSGAGKEGKSGIAIARPEQPTDGSGRGDKKLSDRLSLGGIKPRSKVATSGIPRLAQKRKESKVSTLARHFEQLSREFERERIRDRRERAASLRQPKARLPRTSTKAIVQVYDDVNEAFEEAGSFSEKPSESQTEMKHESGAPGGNTTQPTSQSRTEVQTPKESGAELENRQRTASNDKSIHGGNSQAPSDDEGAASDAEPALFDDFLPDIKELADALEPSTEIPLELPKHQKMSLMKYLTNFWAERSASGWPPLEYPVNATDHIFVDSDVIVREDEPSSVIALALNSDDYQEKLETIRQEAHEAMQRSSEDGAASVEERELPKAAASVDEAELEKSLLRVTGTHLKYQFKEGSAVMTCKIFYAEQFDALRRKCGVAERIIESLSRCLKWDSRGGKTKSVFLKTLDDRLVLKSLSPIETSAFLRFAPGYFSIMAEALFHELPSVIAKMLGFFQVIIKNTVTGSDVKLDLLVTENLFYDRSPKRIFDLKGSMRNRKIQSTGEQNEVLLDENMVEYIYESPLFAREHSKRLLRASVWNDTLFLARQNVMDYSLMIAVDEERKELVVGIIDCIRTYTWDKKLESWIKDRGFAGGGRNRPTVTSPKEYKSRFREAMARYILQAPNCWHLFNNPQYPLYHGKPRLEEAEGDGQ